MKVVSFRVDRGFGYGIAVDKGILKKEMLEEHLGRKLPDYVVEFISNEGLVSAIDRLVDTLSNKAIPMESFRISQPIPNPPKLIFLGLNYMDHAEEQGVIPPSELIIFFKPRTSLTGPYDDVVYPKIVKELDYEGELAVVIGKRCKNVPEDAAMDYVFGYMVMNDVSARDIQFRDKQWTRGKSFDTFAPCGPWIVTKDEVPDPQNLRMVTKVNGEIRQSSSTSKMVFKIPQIIHHLSMVMTLEPGDIISTGTPAGVGYFMRPKPKLLSVGDVVEVYIERVGTIRNRVVAEI